MPKEIPVPKSNHPRVVVIGGGFAGIQFVKRLAGKNYQVVLIDKHNYHTFQPLLYQVATAGLEPDSIAGPLRKQIKCKDYYFRMAIVSKINPDHKLIYTDIGELDYDFLIIASGSKTNYYGNDTMQKKCFSFKNNS